MKQRSGTVLAYVRVSTEEQSLSGLGLADQRSVIEHAATARSWQDVEFVSDAGFSGKSLSRPGITDALQRLARGEAGVLVVAKLDRLSRSLLDFASLMDLANRQGWELVVLDLGIDTTEPSGRLMASVMASFAEYERNILSRRTSAALQQKKIAGARLGRPRTMNPAVTARIVAEPRSTVDLGECRKAGLGRRGLIVRVCELPVCPALPLLASGRARRARVEGGQVAPGGPQVAVNSSVQAVRQGQSRGRCIRSRRAERASRAGTAISWVRMVAVVAFA